jgi:hypothetical protein
MQPQSGFLLASPCRISSKLRAGESLHPLRGLPPRDGRQNRARHVPCAPSRASAIRWPRGFGGDVLRRQQPRLSQGDWTLGELRERQPETSTSRQKQEAPSHSRSGTSSGNPPGPKFGSDGRDLIGFKSANSPRDANPAGVPGWAEARRSVFILSSVSAAQRRPCAHVVKRLSVQSRGGASKHGRELTPRCALSSLAHCFIDQLSRSRDFQQENWEVRL